MDFSIFLLISTIIVAALGFYYLINQLKALKGELAKDDKDVLVEWLKDMKGSVDKNSEVLERQLKDQRGTMEEQMRNQREAMNKQTQLIWERLDKSGDVIREVQKQLGGITEFGKDMKDLSNVLKSPKLRGGLGEQFLYEILANSLPTEMYKTQYKFKDGDICDAVIFTDRGIIPIDSKFPMENFKAMIVAETPEARDKSKKDFIKDVKRRIEEISSKYILPGEGTTEQAIMYVPSENVSYELLVNTPEIDEHLKAKSIILASPNTLSYFLKVLLIAFQQHELEKHAGEILKALNSVKIEAEKFGDDIGVLEHHISNAYKSIDTVKNKYTKLFTKIENIQSIEAPEEKVLLQ
ncbi:hypothetical protein A3K34_04080 [candidate division WWE3 bacterium RIFOXYC1_FULL_40_10]|uniref:DNA recombination protein RmuC n=1 Tax=candidate division WWE3 bacterium RIFOXYA2_FULL_46_9 TaxID=1802636 RepID=A0A1F4W0I4_UNCKA|nr:MAG: hypothetical protein A3K58_04080 [candidate division WWE3 bacterium RIFOXYB1_FULL_40_22]OGC62019.1 MAG: hypothetical protein A3K37_04080 [candidate division WWE3 bacterium RIFOXYA1_FULL_40_11]OGC62936.1 MAG: hypothetical protein A2264_03595 [candidate division WWE3 bacterium RIFOXYA2_FULL_46_9]OGC65036.1 MAG: hypothetical protein A2326_03295 [candidate division WWE3 bacterium RIFOXYB2_FULL_41_6]OGC66402.1 MAG: hypothetical protein A3K34_04080 [candidate division WWE3 bacterium RIFOXYC1_